MIPLLRSIAREVLERSHAIFTLEGEERSQQGIKKPKTDEEFELVARLASEKRELGRSVKELENLGWERDGEGPLQFRCKGLQGEENYTWRPEDSFFFRTVEI